MVVVLVVALKCAVILVDPQKNWLRSGVTQLGIAWFLGPTTPNCSLPQNLVGIFVDAILPVRIQVIW